MKTRFNQSGSAAYSPNVQQPGRQSPAALRRGAVPPPIEETEQPEGCQPRKVRDHPGEHHRAAAALQIAAGYPPQQRCREPYAQ